MKTIKKRGRPASKNTSYKVSIHKIKNFCYASSQKAIEDKVTGKKKYRHIHWGIYNEENNTFYPGKNYFYLDAKEKKKLIFPKNWNLSVINKISNENKYLSFVQSPQKSLNKNKTVKMNQYAYASVNSAHQTTVVNNETNNNDSSFLFLKKILG